MIYLDSSALLKLVFEEAESSQLEAWITDQGDTPLVASELARIEVLRAVHRLDVDAVPVARRLLAGLDLVPLTGGLIDIASEIGDPLLRSLDAIDLATAWSIRSDLTAFVAYDTRLARAAAPVGLTVVQPGRNITDVEQTL